MRFITIYSLYKDFFTFVLPATSDLWGAYRRYYLEPHKDFMESYLKSFPHLTEENLADRVRNIKKEDYSPLIELLDSCEVEGIINSTLQKCKKLLPRIDLPDVYLIIGFFSPDGFVLEVKNKPVIGIGLERFFDFDGLPVVLTHEYGHYGLRWLRGIEGKNPTLLEVLLAEGLSIAFSKAVFPDKPLYKLLFFSQERLNWCRQNEGYLWKCIERDFKSTDIEVIGKYLSGIGEGEIPPRVGYYLGYRLVEERTESIEELLYLVARSQVEGFWPPNQ